MVIGLAGFAVSFLLHHFWNVKIEKFIGIPLEVFVRENEGVAIGALVAVQTQKGKPCNGKTLIAKGILDRIKTLINFWNHNISNFIIRFFITT